MLTLYKRHLPKCGKTNRLEGFTKKDGCKCPIWVEGVLDSKYRRHSLKTNSLADAERQIQKLKDGSHPKEQPKTSVTTALDAFIKDCERRGLSHSTLRKYRTLKKHLGDFARDRKIERFMDFTADAIRDFTGTRKLRLLTAQKELQFLRRFFNFAIECDWITKNPAKQVRPPKSNTLPRVPFSEDQVQKILRRAEDDRELAFLLVLRHSGLRIGDAALLRDSQLSENRLHLRTTKSGVPVSIVLPPNLASLLKALTPRGGYFFLRGQSLHPHSTSDGWRKRIKAICKELGIAPPHPHRFRHTLAADLLSRGVSVENVAAILGNSPVIVAKHYSQWIASRQQALDTAIASTWAKQLRLVKK